MDVEQMLVLLKNFLDEERKLKQYPKKQKLQILCLFYLASKFEPDREYTEKEVNEIISAWHTFEDRSLLRRELCDVGLLDRFPDGRSYWLKKPQPHLRNFQPWSEEMTDEC